MKQQINNQKDKNKSFKQRNETLGAEVRDLKQGNAAIEERARSELGMIKEDEVFYQVIDQPLPTIPPNQLPEISAIQNTQPELSVAPIVTPPGNPTP